MKQENAHLATSAQTHKETNRELEQLINDLEVKLDDGKNDRISLQAKFDQLVEQLNDTVPKSHYDEVTFENAQLTASAESQKASNIELEKLILELEDKLQDEHQKLENALSSLAACPVSAEMYEALQKERDHLQALVEKAQAKTIELEKEAEGLQSELAQSTTKVMLSIEHPIVIRIYLDDHLVYMCILFIDPRYVSSKLNC